MIRAKWSRALLICALGLACLLALFPAGRGAVALGQSQPAYLRLVRSIPTDRLGLRHPAGLAFDTGTGAFLALPAASEAAAASLVAFSPLADRLGATSLAGLDADRPNMAFDRARGRLVFYAGGDLVTLARGGNGKFDPGTRRNFPAAALGLRKLQGMAIDPSSGRLFLLDTSGHRLFRLTPDAQGGLDIVAAQRDGRLQRVDLPALGAGSVRSLAYSAASRRLYLLNPASQTLYELDENGQIAAAHDLAAAGVALLDPESMVVAPSGDQTDSASKESLYIADSRLGDSLNRSGQVVELTFTQQVAVDGPTVPGYLVRATDAFQWATPSSDPMDITYLPASNRFVVSDSEIEEAPQNYWHGGNLFEMTPGGALTQLKTTFTISPTTATPNNFTSEPAGIAYHPGSGHWFFSDDDYHKVYEVDLGGDGAYGTSDDVVTWFATKPCGNNDPEGIAVNSQNGHLLMADGLDAEVFEIAPGPNGVFDGCGASGDDVATHFDTAVYGVPDPEGIQFNGDTGTIYFIGHASNIVETTPAGALVRVIDISAVKAKAVSGLAYAPGSILPGVKNLYLTDRGIDNDGDPTENDGKIYEVTTEPSTQLSFYASADTRVDDSSPTTNYGTSPTLRVRSTGPQLRSFLKFAVGGLSGAVQSAKLRLFVNDASVVGGSAYLVSNDFGDAATPWTEAGLNWNNAPAIAGSPLSTLGAVTLGTWVEFDVTAAIQGNGTYSFGLTSSSQNSVYYNSKEAATNQPELVIITANLPTATPTNTPTATPLVTITPTNTPTSTATSTPTPVLTTLTLAPGADAKVRETAPTSNYGNTNSLDVDGGTDLDVESYLRFAVSGVTGPVQSATLRVYATTGTTNGPAVYGSGTSLQGGTTAWSETAINWNNRPARTSGAADDKGALTANSWVDYNVTALVTGNGTYSFVLATDNTNGVAFSSRQGSFPPQLVIRYGAGPTSTPLPTATSTPLPIATNTPLPTATSTPLPTATSTPLPTATNTPTPVRPDPIFADGFEAGTLAAWNSSAIDGGDLAASAAAKLVGNQGLQAVIDDNIAIYVTDDTPSAEARYRARFRFDPNTLAMAKNDSFALFYGYSGASTVALRVELRYSNNRYQLRAGLINDGGTWSDTGWNTISDAPHPIEIDWRASTAAGANSGGLTLWIDGTQQANLAAIDNDTLRIERVQLGAVAGVDNGTRGTAYFDAFESRRQTLIGP